MSEVGEMNSFSYNFQSHLFTEAHSKIIKKHEIRFAEQELKIAEQEKKTAQQK